VWDLVTERLTTIHPIERLGGYDRNSGFLVPDGGYN
jgi:hypothetical protein